MLLLLLFCILYGLFFIWMGFFVKKYPDTIAGYNTMSPQRKKWVDIDGLSSYLKKMLVITGIIVIAECPIIYLLFLLGEVQATAVLLTVVPIVLLVVAAFRAKKFDSYKKR